MAPSVNLGKLLFPDDEPGAKAAPDTTNDFGAFLADITARIRAATQPPLATKAAPAPASGPASGPGGATLAGDLSFLPWGPAAEVKAHDADEPANRPSPHNMGAWRNRPDRLYMGRPNDS